MKTLNLKLLLILAGFAVIISSCKKDLVPYDSLSEKAALSTPADLQIATYGAYAGLKAPTYIERLVKFETYGSDEAALSITTSSGFYNIYNYTYSAANSYGTDFWMAAYKAIYSANRVIEVIEDGQSTTLDQIKGENLFLRALSHFNLVRIFGRPYTQGQGNNLGIVIKNNTITIDFPARNSVKEVYDFVISDLLKAASLMTVNKNSCFASKEVAWALLSRVYLYMGDNANAIVYANKVITSNRYQLLAATPYKKYFVPVPENNVETIFAIRHNISDDQKFSAIGSQFYNDPVTQATGYGQTYASLTYFNLLDQYPGDLRHSFVEPQRNTDGTIKLKGLVPIIYVNKYNWQDGVANLSSPVILRLAEMYLNRAEANAKIPGNEQLAIDDVNIIRTRAGLSGTQLYKLADLKGRASVLDVVLEERYLEFAFEGHRIYDLFRNNRSMARNYPDLFGIDVQTIGPSDNKIVYLIPEHEMTVNLNMVQNPI